MNSLGEYIKSIRGNRSQEEVATLAGLSGSALSLIEKGEREPRISTLIGLAKALNVSETKLIAAYKGKDPNSETEDNSKQMLEEIMAFLMKNSPPPVFVQTLLEVNGPVLEETRRRLQEQDSQ